MKRTYIATSTLSQDEQEKTQKELKLGYLNLTEGMFEQAKINFMLALQFDSRCADAYWGLMLVKFQIKNEDELKVNPLTYKSAIFLPECEKALEFAEENQKKVFDNLLESVYKVNEGDNY